MKKIAVLSLMLFVLALLPLTLFAAGQQEASSGKQEVTFWMADYDGMRGGYMTNLEEAYNEAYPEYDLDIVMVDWDNLLDKLTTALAGKLPPDASVIGTRWILDFMELDAIVEPGDYLAKETLDNIAPGAMEAKVDGKLMGIPFAAGARFLAYNGNLASKAPATMEELRDLAIEANKDGAYGLIMPGGKHTELTDFCYYFYAAGGEYFDANGRSTVNSAAGVKALEYMAMLANDDKVVQDGYISQDRKQSHPVFFGGKAAYVMIGAWADSEHKKVNADWPIKYGQIPGFKGNKSAPLIITDSIVIYKDGKSHDGVGKFLDFFYQDEWKAALDEAIGFPPVTISAAGLPQFQTPMYAAMAEANLHAKGWPLVSGWTEASDIIWDAVQKVFLEKMTAQEALDEAAAKIDESREDYIK